MKQKIAWCLLFFGSVFSSDAQISRPFVIRYQSFVKGDMTLIANNIVNRHEGSESSNSPYNTLNKSSRNNDEFTMTYIDVDDDKTTFSSSSANLVFTSQPQKIVFAGLYWSATYKYEKGKQHKTNKFVAVDKKRNNLDQVKLKLPNQSKYIDIKGEVLFDGYEKEGFSESAPYAVFANVTAYLQQLSNTSGTYTVANVKATQGMLSGGVSGGWSLVVVYENDPSNGKFVTIYDGFAGITNKSTDIEFNGFQALPEGNVKATIYGSALEGDLKLRGDQLLFKSAEQEEFVTLHNTIREPNNFFTSAITNNDLFFNQRNPNSLNTLGYDAFSIEIANPNNSILANNSQAATLRMKSSGDRYFMFMCALGIEVNVPKEFTPQPGTVPVATTETEQSKTIAVTEKKVVTIEKSSAAVPVPVSKPMASTTTTSSATSQRISPIQSASVAIPNLTSGYYIVANVFAVHANAVRFIHSLQKKGIEAHYFINPKNNYRYVYLAFKNNWDDAQALYHSDINNSYTKALWIMTVNQSTPSVFVDSFAKQKQVVLHPIALNTSNNNLFTFNPFRIF
jgi:hypothetical protein